MKSKTLAVCSSVALMQLFAGMMILTGGCASTPIEEETMPKGAYIPEAKKTEKAPAVDEPPVQDPVPAAPGKSEGFVDPNVKDNVTPPPLPPEPAKKGGETYIVKKGDSLWKIARMHGVSEKELLAYNPKIKPNVIRIGQKIMLPPGAKYNPAKASKAVKGGKKSAKSTVASPSGSKHIVKSGDSLSKIAKMYRVKVSDLASLNGLDVNKPIRVGQTLLIPKGGKAVKASGKSAKKNVKTAKVEAKGVEEKPAQKPEEPAVPAVPAADSAVPAVPAAPAADAAVPAADGAVPAVPAAPAAEAAVPAAPAAEAAPAAGKAYKQVVDVDTTIEALADKQGVTADEIRKKNPSLKGDVIPAGTEVTLP